MRNSRLLLIFLTLLLPLQARAAAEITFRQAAQQMLENNPSYSGQKLNEQMARNRLLQAKGSYLPQVDFTQNWFRSNNPVTVFGTLLNQQSFTAANFAIDTLNNPLPVTDLSSKFQLGWMLFDFGGREGRVGSAEVQSEVASLQLRAARTALLQELVKRYFSVSLAAQSRQTAEEALASAQSRLEQARSRVEQGLVVQSDLLSAQVFVAQREQAKIDAENQARLAAASLADILGQAGEAEPQAGPLVEREFPEHELSWWREQMTANRPELAMVQQAKRLAGEQFRVARAGLLPVVQAWSSYEWHGKDFSYPGNSWGAGLELKWNLFSGFSDAVQLSNARLGEEQAGQKMHETENALWLQVQSAYFDYQSAREKWKVAKAIVDQAAENRRIFAERYASGLVTIHDTLQAESSYNETRLLYSQNLYQLHLAYAALVAAAGRPDDILSIESISQSTH